MPSWFPDPAVLWLNITLHLRILWLGSTVCYRQKRRTLAYSRPLKDRCEGFVGAIPRSRVACRSRARRATAWWDMRRVSTQLMHVGLDTIAIAPIFRELLETIPIREDAWAPL